MGDPKKKHKKYSRPKKLFDSARIGEERKLTKKYGLKNKKEIWKAESEINRIRNLAKQLIVSSQEEQEKFFHRLVKLGLIKKEANIDDVLALTKEALLDRRLQTIVSKKNIAKSPKGARQLIVHRKIRIGAKVIDAPSYVVKSDEENIIQLIKKQKKQKQSKIALTHPKESQPQAQPKQEEKKKEEGEKK